jgi:ABC-type multidrug transport system permease subunit
MRATWIHHAPVAAGALAARQAPGGQRVSAIHSGSGSYVNYLLPGILLITIAAGISYTAFRLFVDMTSGIFERFQSMPIARSSVLWAHVLTSLVANLISLVVVVLVAVGMGFRSGAGVLAWLSVAGILILFTQHPVSTDIWTALAWCLGILIVAYALAMTTYHRKIA